MQYRKISIAFRRKTGLIFPHKYVTMLTMYLFSSYMILEETSTYPNFIYLKNWDYFKENWDDPSDGIAKRNIVAVIR
jgi:hypothetical protein